jgi:hypothetical protein
MSAGKPGRKWIDETGNVYGWVKVLSQDVRPALSRRGNYRVGVFWLCECVCGKTISVAGRNLRKGSTRSCGCLRREVALLHLMTLHANRRSAGRVRAQSTRRTL